MRFGTAHLTCSSKRSGAWGGAALIVAVDVNFGAPTVPASIAFPARVKARPFTEIEQVIWNLDWVTTPCQIQVIQLTVSTLSILIAEEVHEAQVLWKDPPPKQVTFQAIHTTQ